jgi:PAS domain S-box-containing protein
MEKNESVTILYVEDQSDIRFFLSKILSRHYSKVILAEDGKQGLDLYLEHKPDIIISDIKMPVMDGLSMSSKIKEIDPKAKIILTTAHSDMDYFLQSIDIGINQYIIKPIDREKLYHAIETCVNQVMMERELKEKTQALIEKNDELTIREKELRDTLEKTIALKALISKSEENFRVVAENIQDAFWLEANGKVIYVNNAIEKVLCLNLDTIYNNPESFIELVVSSYREEFRKKLTIHSVNQTGSMQDEIKIRCKNGNEKDLLYRDVFIQTDDSGINRRVIAFSDITRQKENEKLQQELLIAEKSAKIKQQFLANISHEMRTPMNGIIAMAGILLKTSLDEKQADYTRTIVNSADNLMGMINDLLDINELEQGKIEIKNQKIEVTKTLGILPEILKPRALEKGLYLNYHFDKDFPQCIFTDRQRVNQVLKNLITNAIKFTEKGGIDIAFSCRILDDQYNEIKIEVADTGIGIERKNQERMFELFTQQDGSDTRSYEGLGIGLTLCRKIAGLLKGRIELESTPGKGSRFAFSFPAKKVECEELIENKADHSKNLNSNVLYAEDKIVNQKVVSILLQNAGCKVDIATNGLEAVRMYSEKKYDLILMDIQMPVMDGITATKELRKKYTDLPPIIGLSANVLKADADFYIQEGLDDYIAKPLTPEKLFSTIAVWLNKKAMGQAKPIDHEPEPSAYSEEKADTSAIIQDFDMNTYQTIKKLAKGDSEIIKDLYQSFLIEAESTIHEIEQGISNRQDEKFRAAVHALKGLSISVGATSIYELTHRMDKLNKQDMVQESSRMFDSLKKKFDIVKQIIIEKIISFDSK